MDSCDTFALAQFMLLMLQLLVSKELKIHRHWQGDDTVHFALWGEIYISFLTSGNCWIDSHEDDTQVQIKNPIHAPQPVPIATSQAIKKITYFF